jgi:serine/threonine protein kinase
MKKIILSEELDVQSVINEYKMCQKLKHSNVVRILGIYNNKLDTTTYVVYVLMEVGLTDWEKEIRKYNDKNLEYTERELIDIIKQLSSVLSFLQKNNISHRDIKPQNILVFKNKIYKVADFGEAKQIDNIAKNLINYSLRGTELYMSPLLFNGLRTGQIDIKHNLFKSDVYSLGLCILYAAVTNNKPLYDIRKYVDMIGIRKYLEKLLKGKYSQKFISLLASMLEIHEKNRPDFVELEKTMKKWK